MTSCGPQSRNRLALLLSLLLSAGNLPPQEAGREGRASEAQPVPAHRCPLTGSRPLRASEDLLCTAPCSPAPGAQWESGRVRGLARPWLSVGQLRWPGAGHLARQSPVLGPPHGCHTSSPRCPLSQLRSRAGSDPQLQMGVDLSQLAGTPLPSAHSQGTAGQGGQSLREAFSPSPSSARPGARLSHRCPPARRWAQLRRRPRGLGWVTGQGLPTRGLLWSSLSPGQESLWLRPTERRGLRTAAARHSRCLL